MFEIATSIGLIVLVCLMIFAAQGPPYVPTNDETAQEMIKAVKVLNPKHILDMGSGNGKLVILLAKEGYRVDGIEINPYLVRKSKRLIREAGLTDKATIKWGSFWSYKTTQYDTVVIYAITHIMPKLEKKLLAELQPGSYIVSNHFVFPNLKPLDKKAAVKVYKI